MPRARLHVRPARPGVLAALAAAGLLAGCSGGSSSAPSTLVAPGRATSGSGLVGAALPPGVVAPAFTLTDQHGHRVSLRAFRGRVIVISFLYPTCGPTCVLVAQQIRGALDRLAHPVTVLLISAEPAADTSANLARFLTRVSLDGRVEYLSGTRPQLEAVWRSYRITPPTASAGLFRRAASVLLIDRRGEERVLFGLEQLTPESLAHDIGKLQAG
jgi:protein SCO1/2